MNPDRSLRTYGRRAVAMSGKVIRYGGAAVGPIGVAGSQFLLSVQLLHVLRPAEFGTFSFLLVASQLSTGIWSALFVAPMPILMTTGTPVEKDRRRRSLMAANLTGAMLAAPVFLALAVLLHAPLTTGLLFGGFAAFNLIRWFGRAHAYTEGRPWRTMASDLVFAGTMLIGIGVGALYPGNALILPFATLFAAAVLGVVAFGRRFLKPQFTGFAARDLAGYSEVWRRHSGWSLTGVLTTEATGNAHAYIVTLLAGANAFAPLAAAALLMRPVSVAANALTDFERPQLARLLADGRRSDADRAVGFFRLMLILAWLGTVTFALVLMWLAPDILFPPDYARQQLLIGIGLWLAVALVRLMPNPDSVMLQAAGQFRSLASASVVSCGVSIVGVTALLLTAGPVWSILGVLAGEMVFALCVWIEKARWTSAGSHPVAAAGADGAGIVGDV